MAQPQDKTLELDCGIAPVRMRAWLEDELELAQDDTGAFLYEADAGWCRVTIAPLGKSGRGYFALERTKLAISGEAGAADAFMRQFTLRFLSAGG